MRIPRPRFDGPVAGRDATALLSVAAAVTVVRLPMHFLMLLVLPLVVVLVQGWRPRAPWAPGLGVLMVWCLGASGLVLVMTRPTALASTANNTVIMVAILAVAAAVFASGRVEQSADRLVDGLYVGLLGAWALSMVEVATGFKFMAVLYPGANTLKAVTGNRFYAAALFPNYNDYSVAMALLCTLVVARMLFRPRVPGRVTLLRLTVVGTAAFLIVMMGSRGALVGLVLGVALVVVVSIRVLHPRAFGIRLVAMVALVALALVVAVMQTPWFRDNSTANRGIILGNIASMLAHDPLRALLGYGSATVYSEAAAAAYGERLMDPHNVLAEIAVWYGLPALVGYLAAWLVLVVRRGLVQIAFTPTWRSVGALAIALLMPVLGVVPASTLRYHVFWLWLVVVGAYTLGRRPRPPRRPQGEHEARTLMRPELS